VANKTFDDIRQGLEAGTVSCVGLVGDYLQRIAQHEDLNAFLEVFGEEALAKAAEIDTKRANGSAGRLAGMILGIKDNIVLRGHKSSASSKILQGYESIFTATALERLLAEDAIIIGRLNCDEFAMGSSNENSAYGNVKNPLDTKRVPGGSSGGCAAAVAAGLCTAALGSDTGGSIRQPAAFCGLVGLKPTYGRISRYGLIAYGSSFDQISPIANNTEDTASLLEVMAGLDPKDTTSSSKPIADYREYLNHTPEKPLRFAVLNETLQTAGLQPEIRAQLDLLIEKLKQQGHTVEVASFPYLDYLVPTYYVLTTAEASSNLSRFDGIRYGYRSATAEGLGQVYTRSRSEGFGPEVKRRILLGTFVLSSGYYDAYYTRAMKMRRLIREATVNLLSEYDFLLSPTTPTTAFAMGEKTDDPISMYLSDIFTVHANLAGQPALSVPYGQDADGMPIGMHLLAADFDEARLLQAARIIHNLD
jgi:aspartyl-tRNA(Asn)/glutamyl-tRNA(Gln) amidotransferase subunit A